MEFACKNFDIEEVVRCGLGLTKGDYKILKFLIDNQSKKFNTENISLKLGLDLSTVQRSLKKMTEKKLVRRSQINLNKGGYSFIYCVCDKGLIKNSIKEIISAWVKKFNSEIDKW